MAIADLENLLKKLVIEFNLETNKDNKLVVFLGLLGDFDSFEYGINASKYLKQIRNHKIDIFLIAIGSEKGKDKFCSFTGFPKNNLKIVKDNSTHQLLGASKGIDTGLGGWINLFIMLLGIGSPKTIPEVIRGYTGDKNSDQIYHHDDNIELFKFIELSGKLFEKSFGTGYLRPFELATFRLKNMIEIFNNWKDYMIDTEYLTQRGATFLLNKNNKIIYRYYSKDILDYSQDMSSPLKFIDENLDK